MLSGLGSFTWTAVALHASALSSGPHSRAPRAAPAAATARAAAAALAVAAAAALGGSAWAAAAAPAPAPPPSGPSGTAGTTAPASAAADPSAGGAPPIDLPTEKLSCKRAAAPPRAPVVLVSAGSFNPPTHAHLRMCEAAAEELGKRGHDVWGCYLSPVADAYGKKGLAPSPHRVEMCRLAAEGSGLVMVDGWEAARPGYTRTLEVLRHVARELGRLPWAAGGAAAGGAAAGEAAAGAAAAAAGGKNAEAAEAAAAAPPAAAAGGAPGAGAAAQGAGLGGGAAGGAAVAASGAPRVMLLCGADVAATMAAPGVWVSPEVILREHGVVVVDREGTDLERLLAGGAPISNGGGGGGGEGQGPGSGAAAEPAAARGGGAGSAGPGGRAAAGPAGSGGGAAAGNVLSQNRDCVIVVRGAAASDISSTAVRAELAAGCTAEGLAPDAVLRYAARHGLYRGGGPGSGGGGGGAAVGARGGEL